MATFRIHKKNNYFVCPNQFLNNANLSWRAKGILTYLLSKPDDWVVQVQDIINHAKEAKTAARSALAELLEHGYMRKRIVREDGKFARFEYDVFEIPVSQYLVSEPFPENGEMVKDNIFELSSENQIKEDIEAQGLSWSNPKH